MVRKDKLKVIYNAFKLLAPNKEYDLTDYDIFRGTHEGYVQIYLIKKSIYIEKVGDMPDEIITLFKLNKLSDTEITKVFDIIERNHALINTIGIPGVEVDMYKATPINRNLFKTI
jgi:hypothetical protein